MTHITPHRLTGDQARISNDVQQLYEVSFPDEPIRWETMCSWIDGYPLDATAWRDPNGTLCAITIVRPLPEANWLWSIAVDPDMRCAGIGSHVLQALMQQYQDDKPLFAEMQHPGQPDAPDTTLRRRRRDFYIRNGWRDTEEYANYNTGVIYTVMVTGSDAFGSADYRNIVNRLFPGVLLPRDND